MTINLGKIRLGRYNDIKQDDKMGKRKLDNQPVLEDRGLKQIEDIDY